MNTGLQIALVVLSGLSTLIMALMFFVLRDLRDRIVRLENRAMNGAAVGGISSARAYGMPSRTGAIGE
jgi:hypothetical protein